MWCIYSKPTLYSLSLSLFLSIVIGSVKFTQFRVTDNEKYKPVELVEVSPGGKVNFSGGLDL